MPLLAQRTGLTVDKRLRRRPLSRRRPQLGIGRYLPKDGGGFLPQAMIFDQMRLPGTESFERLPKNPLQRIFVIGEPVPRL